MGTDFTKNATVTVTELRESAPKRFVVGFSDGTELKLSLDIVADLSLFKGRELSEQEYSTLRTSAGLSKCKERALRIIGARPLSARALFDRLVEKGETPENAQESVAWLIRLHYLDDAQYADMVVRHYAGKGYGVQKIKGELFRRGVPKTLWDQALEGMPETDDRVFELLSKKLGGVQPDRAELKRATDALFRRGFTWDEINAAVRRYSAENQQ